MTIQWEECSLDDATHVEINGEVHEIVYGGKVLKSGKSSIDGKYLCISILIGMYNWMQIPQEAFPFLGIKPLRKVKREPIEFEGIVKESKLSFLFLGNVPEGIPLGKKFRCVEILEDEE